MNARRPLLGSEIQTTDGPQLWRVELYGDLLPGQSADCHPVFFDGTNYKADTGVTYRLYDSLGQACAFGTQGRSSLTQGERLWALKLADMVGAGATPDPNRYEVVHEFGLLRRAKLTGSLSKGSSASAELYLYDGSSFADSGHAITVYDWILSTGDTAASGTRIWVRYEPTLAAWGLVSGQCSAD